VFITIQVRYNLCVDSTKNVYIIVGPTSTGKTTLALKLAQKCNAEIISADSRQVVKYMDIGTGKMPVANHYTIEKYPDKWIVNGINIWGYDLITPDSFFSAYDYSVFASKKIQKLLAEQKTVFIVGGTGFYIDVLVGRAGVSRVMPDYDLRDYLNGLSLEELRNVLSGLNEYKLSKVDVNNKVRLIRAIEIEKNSQNVKNVQSAEKDTALPHSSGFAYKFIGLTAGRAVLYSRADKWLNAVWDNGLPEEVINLRKMGFGESRKLKGLVYKSCTEYLDGTLNEQEARERAKFDLHSYIRRQQTWFKRNEEINWFDIAASGYRQNVEDFVELHCG